MRAKLSTGALLFALISPLQAATLPASGMSMQAVEQQFGAPIKKNAAIGHPPITRWEYNGYVVVFERSTVIQSVEVVGTAAPAPVAKPVAAPAPAAKPVAAPSAPAPAPAPVVAVPVKPAPAPVVAPPPSVDTAEAERQARESEAMARARAEREAASKAAAAPAPAPVAQPAAPVVDSAPTAVAAPVTPPPAPAEEPKKPKGDGSYTFDPATGRIIIN